MSGAWPCLALVTLWPWDHGLLEPINRGLGLETGKAGPRSLPVALCPSHAVGGKGGTRQQQEKGRCGMRAVFHRVSSHLRLRSVHPVSLCPSLPTPLLLTPPIY